MGTARCDQLKLSSTAIMQDRDGILDILISLFELGSKMQEGAKVSEFAELEGFSKGRSL